MSFHRRRPSSPAAAPPLEDENLLSEILLRLSPEPSSLPRASAVCKRWRHLVSDPRFFRRFRVHHRRNPPLIGFIDHYFGCICFEPTLEAPNRVAPGLFSLQQCRGDSLRSLGSRHGLVLLLDLKRKQVLVWDPVTGDQDRIALPSRFDAEDRHANGAVLRAAGDVHFQVVLVVSAREDELHTRVLARVYSSETGVWGNLISTLLPSNVSPNDDVVVFEMPAVLVGDSLYWTIIRELSGILKFDLERQSLAVIPWPMELSADYHELTVMRAEGGGLGFLLVSREDLSAQLWKRNSDCDGVASWELGRTIELDKLLPLNSMEERKNLMIVGFAEYNKAVFLWTSIELFVVHLESFQFKNVLQTNSFGCCQPFESVYAAGTSIGGGHGEAELLHNT